MCDFFLVPVYVDSTKNALISILFNAFLEIMLIYIFKIDYCTWTYNKKVIYQLD